MTVTQFIWNECLGLSSFEPHEPKGKKTKYGQDAQCWLCGGNTNYAGWHIGDIIESAFTDGNEAKRIDSATICQSCAALMKKEGWVIACEKFGADPYFPIKDGKNPFLSNWMFSSHIFSKDGWIRPDRAGVRNALIDPPAAPFVMTIAAVGKKHVIFRADVNMSRDVFFVQLDETKIFVDRAKMQELMLEFESAYSAGFSKESLLTGKYNHAAVLSFGIENWRAIENRMSTWRSSYPDLMLLCNFCAQKQLSAVEYE